MNINEIIEHAIDRYWNWRLLDIPEFATFVGEHKYDDRLMDMSLNGYLRRRDDARAWLDEARKIRKLTHADPPSNECKIHLDYLELEVFLDGLSYQTYLCPMNPTDGPHIRFPRLISWMKKGSVEDFNMITRRFRQVTVQVGQMIELMTEGIRLQKTVHLNIIQTYPTMLEEFIEKVADDPLHSLRAPFVEKPELISYQDWDQIVNEGNKLLDQFVMPAFKSLKIFIEEEYIPKARHSHLPKDLYEAYVRFHTERDITPEWIFKTGQEKIKNLLPKLDEQQKKIGFKGTRREFLDHLRTDAMFAFTSREEMVEVYTSECQRVYGLLSKIFSKYPKMPYEIIQAPKEIEKHYCVGAYVAGDNSKDRPGLFILNTYSPPNRKRYDIPAIILHEALPGHHIQLALTAESGLKDYRRFADELRWWDLPAHVGMKSSYHEGWATYAEFLGHELGLYDDVYTQIGSISRNIELACRYVVYVGLHVQGWSREKAIEFMLDNTAVDAFEVETEVDRYSSLPAQSLAYLYGSEKFKEYRKKAEKALGDQFNVKTFHTMLCSLGDVPLFIVEGQVDKYIYCLLYTSPSPRDRG